MSKIKFYAGVSEFHIKVDSIDEFPRGEDGTCALCKGDPCCEHKRSKNSLIAKFYKENPNAVTCPCCDGRPT